MEDFFDLILAEQQKKEIQRIITCNDKTQKYNLILSEEDAKALTKCRKDSLKENQRVEFGQGILPEIIDAFCDSQYINQDNYVDTLAELQEIFYIYKNESLDELTDMELISFMKRQFETICFGDLEYLSSTCLERFTRATRGGYTSEMQHRLRDEYSTQQKENEYSQFDEEARWDFEVYKIRLKDLF